MFSFLKTDGTAYNHAQSSTGFETKHALSQRDKHNNISVHVSVLTDVCDGFDDHDMTFADVYRTVSE